MIKHNFAVSIDRRLVIFFSILLCCGLGVGQPLIVAQSHPESIADRVSSSGVLVEEFSFYIKDFKMGHQGEVQTLNIKMSAQYLNGIRVAAYPDFRLIARDVETYLSKYPNKTDYWEVVNKKLTQLILEKYPAVSRVMSEIEVAASPLIPYVRTSTVTRQRRKK